MEMFSALIRFHTGKRESKFRFWEISLYRLIKEDERRNANKESEVKEKRSFRLMWLNSPLEKPIEMEVFAD